MTLLENVELPMRFAEIDRGDRAGLARKALDRVGLGGAGAPAERTLGR